MGFISTHPHQPARKAVDRVNTNSKRALGKANALNVHLHAFNAMTTPLANHVRFPVPVPICKGSTANKTVHKVTIPQPISLLFVSLANMAVFNA